MSSECLQSVFRLCSEVKFVHPVSPGGSVNFILQKFCPCKKNDKLEVCQSVFRVSSEFRQSFFRVSSEFLQSFFRVSSEYVQSLLVVKIVVIVLSIASSSVSVFGIFLNTSPSSLADSTSA